MLWIHIIGGLVAILAGFVALFARKGSSIHRSFGRAFVYAIVLMTISATVMAGFLRPNPGNVVAAMTTFYLVGTSWLAVKLPFPQAKPWNKAFASLGAGVALYGLTMGYIAFQTPSRSMGGIPAVAILVFALIGLASVAGDLRLLRRNTLEGPARLLRHLWRMTFALWIAVGSFFLGQADEFPAAVRATGLLPLPVLIVTGALVYWVARQTLAARRARRLLKATTGAASPMRVT